MRSMPPSAHADLHKHSSCRVDANNGLWGKSRGAYRPDAGKDARMRSATTIGRPDAPTHRLLASLSSSFPSSALRHAQPPPYAAASSTDGSACACPCDNEPHDGQRDLEQLTRYVRADLALGEAKLSKREIHAVRARSRQRTGPPRALARR